MCIRDSINPMAVEMAKLSLWLITVDANRPFTFLDHAFKCGDSLLGITSLEQLENFSLRPGGGKQQAFATLNLWRHIEEAKKKREMLEAMPSDTPVSYTHLWPTVTAKKCWNVAPMPGHVCSPASAPCMACLLYTSRCV